MSNVSLTSAMSSNLLSLKQTTSLMSMTQNRLATGLKVNSAIDNPSAYYTAVSLNNRAADLNALLDNMGQAIQTVKAAVEAVETASAFLAQMQSITEQALAEPSTLQTNIVTPSAFSIARNSRAASVNLQTRPIEEFKGYTKITADMSTAEIQALITEGAKLVLADNITLTEGLKIDVDNVTIDGNGHKMKYITDEWGNNLLMISGNNAKINNIGFAFQSDAGDAIDIESAENVKMNNFTIIAKGCMCRGVGIVEADIEMTNFNITVIGEDACSVLASKGAQIKLDSDSGIKVSGVGSKKFDYYGTGEIIIDSSLTGAWSESEDEQENEPPIGDETNSITENIGVAVEWSKAFNDVLNQYDMLIDDASYRGINLLKGEQLSVAFNEDKSSRLNILGKDIHSSALGLSSADWQTVDDVNVAVEDLKRCVATLRSLSSELGNNYSVVQSRQDFTESLINILTEGADKLTLADMNEESAIMLALQTRQQLAINSLSLASQSAQSVLRLFS